MKDTTRKALELFIEKADHLMSRRFMQAIIAGGGTNLTLRFRREGELEDGKGWLEMHRTGPDQEAIEAFVLTYRQFFQHNDRFSFFSLAKSPVLSDSGLSNEWKQRFTETWTDLQECLNTTAEFVLDGVAPTYGYLLEVFIYGGLAHTTPDKRATFEEWRSDPMLYGLLEHSFIGTLMIVLRGIWEVRQCSAKELGLPLAEPPRTDAQSGGTVGQADAV